MLKTDYIIRSRNILRCDGSPPFSGSVAVSGSSIAAVSPADLSDSPAASGAEVIDCGDRLVVPGFCDSHVHMLFGSLQRRSADLSAARSEREAAEQLRKQADPAGNGWLFGFGWACHNWNPAAEPSRLSLDGLFPGRPVCLFNDEMHSIWVNSAALRECGINGSTPDPQNGFIRRDAGGDPSGLLVEPEAIKMVLDKAFDLPLKLRMDLTEDFMQLAAESGVTAVSDIAIYDMLDCTAYEKLEAEGKLTVRTALVFPLKTGTTELEQHRRKYCSDRLFFSGVKEFLDGTASMHTGCLIEPYADRPGFRGGLLADPALLTERAAVLDAAGIRIRFHACGSGAVKAALDIFEEVRRRNGFSDTRHTIEHIEDIDPPDIPRFAQLGITASLQPDHLMNPEFAAHPFLTVLPPGRQRWAWAFRSIIESGAPAAFGTDFPIAPLNPLTGIYRAVTRLHGDGKPKGGWIPEEKISAKTALEAYTAGSAKQMYRENNFGTLLAGMKADLAVIDGNPLTQQPEDFAEAGIFLTMMNGRPVYGPGS